MFALNTHSLPVTDPGIAAVASKVSTAVAKLSSDHASARRRSSRISTADRQRFRGDSTERGDSSAFTETVSPTCEVASAARKPSAVGRAKSISEVEWRVSPREMRCPHPGHSAACDDTDGRPQFGHVISAKRTLLKRRIRDPQLTGLTLAIV